MQQAKSPPISMEVLRMAVPSWFIFAGLLCAMLPGLVQNQMLAFVMFGAFLSQAAYFAFFSSTISPIFPESPHTRPLFGASSLLFLAAALFFLFFN
jgi:hypothetical protein